MGNSNNSFVEPAPTIAGASGVAGGSRVDGKITWTVTNSKSTTEKMKAPKSKKTAAEEFREGLVTTARKEKKYNIYLIPHEKVMEEAFKVPLLPAEIKATARTNYKTYKIITKGECLIPQGTDCNEYSWSGVIPGKHSYLRRLSTQNMDPKKVINRLLKWMRAGSVITLVISQTPVNTEVTISDFSYEYSGAFGDVKYDITLKVYRNLQIYTTKDLGIKTPNTKLATKKGNRGSKSSLIGKTYTIKKGDTLYGIALKVYGDGAKWEKIWKKNQKILDAAVQKKKNDKTKNSDKGRILIAGTKIKIP